MCALPSRPKRVKKKEPKIHRADVLQHYDKDFAPIEAEFAPMCGAQWPKQYLITRDWTVVTCQVCLNMKRGVQPGVH